MKRFLCSHSGNINSQGYQSYRIKYVTLYRKVIRMAKKLAIQEQIIKAKNSIKEMWKVVNRHTNKSNKIRFKNITLKHHDKYHGEPTAVANIFAEYFDFSNITQTGENSKAISFLQQYTVRVINEMNLCETDEKEIEKIIKKMSNKKSCGYDEIPIRVIKDHVKVVCGPLVYFYNKCLSEGIFPEQLKIARIIPVHKKGSKSEPKNYRPISLLPILSKIFEKLLKTRLMSHLTLNGVLNLKQYGYQTSVGTADAVNALVNDVVTRLNQKKKVSGIFLDLSSAFDTVDHTILIKKLEHYGIRGTSLKLFSSYLYNRKMYVEVKDKINDNQVKDFKSKMTNILTGVPQGSILGPSLFIVFTNDLIDYMINMVPDIELVVYADDTNAIISADDMLALRIKMNDSMAALSQWFSANNLIINVKKTNVMLFKTTSRNKDSLDTILGNDIVKNVQTVKLLGIHIDSYLSWKNELASIESSIASACYALRTLRDEASIDQLKLVYYALIESKLRYSIQFWGNSYKYNGEKAFILQKRGIRTIMRIPQTVSCRDYFKRLSILTVPSLYVHVLLSFLAKYLPVYETEKEKEVRLSTRNKNIKNTVHPNLNIMKHSSNYQAVEIFNKLPTELKEIIHQPTVFKNKLRIFLLDKCLYSLDDL